VVVVVVVVVVVAVVVVVVALRSLLGVFVCVGRGGGVVRVFVWGGVPVVYSFVCVTCFSSTYS